MARQGLGRPRPERPDGVDDGGAERTGWQSRQVTGRGRLSGPAARDHRGGAAARNQAAGGCRRRKLRRQPDDHAQRAGPSGERRFGDPAGQPARRGGRPDPGGRARPVPGPARPGAHGGRDPGRAADQGPGGATGRPCRCGERRRRPRRPGLDPARRRIPHAASRHDRQRDPGPLCQRSGLARLAGAGDLRPAALV